MVRNIFHKNGEVIPVIFTYLLLLLFQFVSRLDFSFFTSGFDLFFLHRTCYVIEIAYVSIHSKFNVKNL